MLNIPTEPIGSIPRPPQLLEAIAANPEDPALEGLYEAAVRDTIEQFEATGSPVITDGEQRKYHNFLTYCVHGLAEYGPRRLQDSIRGGPHAAHPSADRRTVPLPEIRGPLPRRGPQVRASPSQAGGDFPLGA